MADQANVQRRYSTYDIDYSVLSAISGYRVVIELVRYFPLYSGMALITCVFRWARSGEFIALLCAGMSVQQIVMRLLALIIPMCLIFIVALSAFSAYAARERANLISELHGRGTAPSEIDERGQWISFSRDDGFYYSHFSAVHLQKREIYGIRFFHVDNYGELQNTIYAKQINVVDDSWQIRNGVIVDSMNIERSFSEIEWKAPVSFQRIRDGFFGPEMISLLNLPQRIKDFSKEGLQTKSLRYRFSYLYTQPLILAVILIWSLVIALEVAKGRTNLAWKWLLSWGIVGQISIFIYRILAASNVQSLLLSHLLTQIIPVVLITVGLVLLNIRYAAKRPVGF